MATAINNTTAGYQLAGFARTMTRLRQNWYGNAQVSAIAGEPRQIGVNIHTDSEYAREQGWQDVNASGMVSTSWISSMLVAEYGRDYMERGELRNKYIRPIFMDGVISVGGSVDSVEEVPEGRLVHLTVWCKDASGMLLTEGEAHIEVRNRT